LLYVPFRRRRRGLARGVHFVIETMAS